MLALLLALISLVGCTVGTNITLAVTASRSSEGEYEATLTFDMLEEVNGWEVVLEFSGPVVSIDQWKGDEVSHTDGNRRVTLVNKPHNGIQHVGDTLEIIVTVAYSGTTGPTGTATFINMGLDDFEPQPAPPETDGAAYEYNEVLEKSILFYEAQRSGKLPANNRVPWRADSALDDQGSAGEDLTGGWYDAGDHVKFNFPMAFSVTSLAWGLLQFKDAYEDAGQLDYFYDSIRWPLDYLLKCHVSPNVLYGQVGNGGLDHAFWGRPEDMTMDRPAYKIDESNPGRDLAAETAAAFAASYMVFKSSDPSYASTLLSHAKELFQFAEDFPGLYSDSIEDAAGYYRSYDDTDEMCWAGSFMYLATGEEHYLDVAEEYYIPGAAWGQSWDEKLAGCMVLLYKITQKPIYLEDIEATFVDWMPGGEVDYTPKGLAWRLQWGSNRYSANMAFIALMASEEGVHPLEYRQWAESQINYMLGDNGRSYLVGFGNNPPVQPHHRAASCPMMPAPCASFQEAQDGPSPHTLYGALVGGPSQDDSYTDRRSDYTHNEVACDYNAGFQSAVAGLKYYYMTGDLP